MFPGEDGKWEQYKIRPIKKPAVTNGDVEMGGVADGEEKKDEKDDEDEDEFEEDLESDEGAVYPLQGMPVRSASPLSYFDNLTKLNRWTHNKYARISCFAPPRTQHSQSYSPHPDPFNCSTSMDCSKPRDAHPVLL